MKSLQYIEFVLYFKHNFSFSQGEEGEALGIHMAMCGKFHM